jgi:hypothetical protein
LLQQKNEGETERRKGARDRKGTGNEKEGEGRGILTIVTEMRVEDGSEHEGLVEEGRDPLLVRLDADNTVLGEGSGSVREESDGLEQVLDEDGLEDVELDRSRKREAEKGQKENGREKRVGERRESQFGRYSF